MGYGFICKKRKTDKDDVFYTSCMYQYQPIFRECFGKEITEFTGRVTKAKTEEFKIGIEKFISNPEKYNKDNRQFAGYMSNITYGKLAHDLLELLHLMESKEIGYLNIN